MVDLSNITSMLSKKDLDVVPSRAGLGLVPSKADPTLFGPSLLSFILHFKRSN